MIFPDDTVFVPDMSPKFIFCMAINVEKKIRTDPSKFEFRLAIVGQRWYLFLSRDRKTF